MFLSQLENRWGAWKYENCWRTKSYGLDDRRSIPRRSREFFPSPRPERMLGLRSLLFHGYRGLFLKGWSGRGVELTFHFPVPRLRTRRTLFPWPHSFSWCGVLMKMRDKFTLTKRWRQYWVVGAMSFMSGLQGSTRLFAHTVGARKWVYFGFHDRKLVRLEKKSHF